jgi:hypothetical protein
MVADSLVKTVTIPQSVVEESKAIGLFADFNEKGQARRPRDGQLYYL